MRKIIADDLHPMRFLRRFPDAREMVRIGAKQFTGGYIAESAFEQIAEACFTAYNRDLAKLPFDQRPANADVINGTISTVCHVAAFMHGGRNSFQINPDLVDLLSQTDIGDIRLSDIQLPFSSFYVAFAGGLSVGLPGPPNVIDGVYVQVIDTATENGPSREFSFYLTTRLTGLGHRGKSSWITDSEPHFFAPLTANNQAVTLLDAIDDAVAQRDIELTPDYDKINQLKSGADGARAEGVPISVSTVTGYERAALFNQSALPTVQHVLGLVCNVLCLITTQPQLGDIQWPADAPSSLVEVAHAATTLKRRRTAVGRLAEDGFFPIRQLLLVPNSQNSSPETVNDQPTGYEVATHWRRGHWRRQPFGQSMADRRLVWIRPVLVRKDKGEAKAAHVYEVDVRKGLEGQ